jgi:hypothetical protein
MRGMRPAALLAALLLAAPEPARTVRAEETCAGEAQGFQRLQGPRIAIAYRWEPTELKVGQFFAVEVVDCGSLGGPVDRIVVDATMPAHGHGMNYRPIAERIAPGRHRFTGLMLHMPGTWRFTFTLYKKSDVGFQLTRDVELKR